MSSIQTINTNRLKGLVRYPEVKGTKTTKASKKEKGINVNTLEKVATTLLKKSETTLSKERLTNTVRRADMAENIKSNARKELRLAKTILNLVEAIKAGKSKYLAGIRSRSQVQALEYILRAAKSNRSRYLKYSELDSKDREVEILDINFVKYPYPWITKHNFKQLNLLGQKITGLSGFLVDLNILFTLDLKKQDSDKLYFDNDQKLWLLRDTIQKLKTSDHHAAKDMADFLVSQSQDCELLQNLGIKDLHTLIKALEEYFQYRSNQIQEDPVKRLERELIGVKIPNYFPTPKKIIEKMLDLAGIDSQENLKILEPSAGSGHLADEIKKRAVNSDLSVIEINHHLKEILEAKGHNLVARDFLYHKENYSIIIMNPPFSDGEAHLQHAYELLYPGGRVISIMGEGSFFRTDKKTLEFREWLDSVGGYSEKLPDGSFLNSDRPTGVAARIVLIAKPADSGAEIDTRTIPDNSKIDDSTTINPVINVVVNPNLEILSEAAKDIAEKAEGILAQDTEVRTYEQAITAKSVDFEARKQLQLASTIASIVQAIQSGKTHFLSSVKDQCDVEILENLLQEAKHQRPKEIGKVLKDCEPELTDLELVRYPYPILTMLILGKVSEIKTVEGLNTITTRFAKLVDVEAKNRGYLIFKEPSQIKDFEEMVNLVKPVNNWLEEMLMFNEKLVYYKALQTLGLTDLPTLIEGLKEYLILRIDTPKINPIKALELHVMGIGIEGYFYTPKAVVAKMLDFANIQADTKILNAFAGAGNIADGIKNLHPTCNISVIEIDWKLKEVLTAKGYNIVDSNVFEHQENYQLVLMNPPNRYHYDITCFYQAYNLLVPGGKLVSIITEESFSSNSDYSIGFRKWLKRLGGISQILPDGSLIDKRSSTNIAARIVVVDKSSLF